MSVAFVGAGDVRRAIGAAATVTLSAYTLGPGGAMERVLERAAARGAAVRVTLDGAPFERSGSTELADRNRAVADDLRAHGVGVRLTEPGEHVHLKAAIADGVAYLDDRNWPSGGDTIVATTRPGDVALVAAALAGRPGAGRELATRKDAALHLESALIRASPGTGIDVESESFGPSVVARELRRRARLGTHVRLLVGASAYAASPSERRAVARLTAAGVEIRLGSANEKLCVGEGRGWVGSANATSAEPAMADWGLAVRSPPMVGALRSAFEANWNAAAPLPAGGLT